ncbi:hypothetical protein CXB51_026540 [Gossypium anomalum]|uniref:Uncharacterized protein n=1 Tax=Gossypium anomalum TaxID=47600 RepID=A0A8J5YBF7_9ROSI|nr:hypothetical protein CXB51_026540 [Gossypium anomalum]
MERGIADLSIEDGYGDNFCPGRLNHEMKMMVLGWDFSLHAQPRRATAVSSIWRGKKKMREFSNKKDPDEVGFSNRLGRVSMKFELEDNLIEIVEGKKRHCSDKSVSNVSSVQDSLEATNERVTPYTQKISTAISEHADRTK